jgi:hypothetical protein
MIRTFRVREAILRFIEDFEDRRLAKQRLADLRDEGVWSGGLISIHPPQRKLNQFDWDRPSHRESCQRDQNGKLDRATISLGGPIGNIGLLN